MVHQFTRLQFESCQVALGVRVNELDSEESQIPVNHFLDQEFIFYFPREKHPGAGGGLEYRSLETSLLVKDKAGLKSTSFPEHCFQEVGRG